MTSPSDVAFETKLKALSAKIDDRLRVFRSTGQLSSDDKGLADSLEARHAAVLGKLNTIPRDADGWASVKEEFERDYHALSEEVRNIEAKLDGDAMRFQNKSA